MITVLHVTDLPRSNHWYNGLAEHFDRSRFRHLLVTLGPQSTFHSALAERNVQAFALDAPSRKQYPLAIARLARLIRRERVDIVQTNMFEPSSVGLPAAKLARAPLTILTRHHSNFTTLFNKPIHRQIDRLHAMTADYVWSPSQYIKDCMMKLERVPGERIHVLPHGFDFARMKPRLTVEQRTALRETIGGDPQYLIGMVARLSIEKAHEDLFRAAQKVVRQCPRTRFVVVGDGPRRDELHRMVRELGLADKIHFTGWRDDAWDLIESMDLIAHSSLHEPFGIISVEAGAMGRAIVTTSDSGAPEIIDHGETGLLVPPRSPEALGDAILTLVEDPERTHRMGEEARRRVEARFNYPKIMRTYEDAYTTWLAARTNGRLGATH